MVNKNRDLDSSQCDSRTLNSERLIKQDDSAKVQHLLNRLKQSTFRSSFRLKPLEIQIVENKPIEIIMLEGLRFIETRLAPFQPKNDGAQTPMKGHPVFVAQHATATCCRSCLMKWHRIPDTRALNSSEIEYILQVIQAWIEQKMAESNLYYAPIQQTLF